LLVRRMIEELHRLNQVSLQRILAIFEMKVVIRYVFNKSLYVRNQRFIVQHIKF
jgi:hypothetical protein